MGPPGVRFRPSEEELINCFLKAKVLGQNLPSNDIKERQVYGPNSNPWQVFKPDDTCWIKNQVSPGRFEKIMYVFVKLTKKANDAVVDQKKKKKMIGNGREHFIKKAGCGTWDAKTGREKIKDAEGNVIGQRRFLVFEINQLLDHDQHMISSFGYWKMHEYSLCGVNEMIDSSGIVVCKITVAYSKKCPVNLRPMVNVPRRGKAQQKAQNNMINDIEGTGSSISESFIVMESNHHHHHHQVVNNEVVVESYDQAVVNDSIDDDIGRLASEVSSPPYVKEDFCVIQEMTSSHEIDKNLQMGLSEKCWPVESDSSFIETDHKVDDDDDSWLKYLNLLITPEEEELTVEDTSNNSTSWSIDEKKDENFLEAKLPIQDTTTTTSYLGKRNSEDETLYTLATKKSRL